MKISTATTALGTSKQAAQIECQATKSVQLPQGIVEAVTGFILLLMFGAYFYDALRFPVSTSPNVIGVGEFPIIIATVTLLAVAVMCCLAFAKLFHKKNHELIAICRPLSVALAAVVLVSMGSYFDSLGPILGVLGLSALIMLATGERRPLQVIAVSSGLAVGLYIVFVLVLGVSFS